MLGSWPIPWQVRGGFIRDPVGVLISDGRHRSVRYLTQQSYGTSRVLVVEANAAGGLSFKRQRVWIKTLYERVKTEL